MGIRARRAQQHARRCEAILAPQAAPKPTPQLLAALERQRHEDIKFLRATIKQQIEQTEWDAAREDNAGNHRQARLLRLTIPDIPAAACKEYGKDLALLAELDRAEEKR